LPNSSQFDLPGNSLGDLDLAPPQDHGSSPDLKGTRAALPPGLSPASVPLARLRPASTTRPPGLALLPTPASLVFALRHCWLLALTTALFGGLVTALLLWALLPSSWTAEVWLQIERPSAGVPSPNPQETEPNAALPTQAVVLKSPQILAETLREPDVANLPELAAQGDATAQLAWLDRILTVQMPNPSVCRLSAQTDRPQTATALTAAVVRVYLKGLLEQRRTFLHQLRESSRRSEELLREQQKPLDRLDDPRLVGLEKSLQQASFGRKKAEAELAAHQARAKTSTDVTVPESVLAEQLQKDEVYGNQQRELARIEEFQLQVERRSALKTNDPQWKKYARQADLVRQQMAERRQSRLVDLERQLRDKAADEHQQRQAQLGDQVKALQDLERTLQTELRVLTEGLPTPAALVKLREDVAARQEALKRLGGEIKTLETEGVEAVGVRSLGESAAAPAGVGERSRLVFLSAFGVFACLFLAVGWLEFDRRCVRSPVSVSAGLRIPVLGTLPNLPGELVPVTTAVQNLGDLARQTRLAEAVDVLRTLLLSKIGDHPCVLLVTSAGPGEGKTSLAGQLAASLSRAWRRTLLIDGNLRRPAAHALFGLPLEPGLSEVLRGEVDPHDAIQPTKLSRLWMMPAGHWDNHAFQALAQNGEQSVFESLKEQYDFVVIDGCPALPGADALLLGTHADVTLMAVRSGTSQLPPVYTAWQRVTALAVPVVEAVVIEV
jgi:polysaccharide biosynthesis transport protein